MTSQFQQQTCQGQKVNFVFSFNAKQSRRVTFCSILQSHFLVKNKVLPAKTSFKRLTNIQSTRCFKNLLRFPNSTLIIISTPTYSRKTHN